MKKRRSRIKTSVKVLMRELRPRGNRTKDSFYKRFKNYDKYLKSNEWKKIRTIYFNNIGAKKCISCQSKKTIQLHHKSYKRLGSVNEIKDLVSVCQKCHNEIHKLEKTENITLSRATSIILKKNKKEVQYKPRGKTKKFQKPTRLEKLKVQSSRQKSISRKDNLIREIKTSGISADLMSLPISTIEKIHAKYVN